MNARTKLIAASALLCLPASLQAKWVASWVAPPHAPIGTDGPFAAAAYENVTLSQRLRGSEGGKRSGVACHNRHGPAPLTIGAARIVRVDDEGKEIAGTTRALTFGGEGRAVIPR